MARRSITWTRPATLGAPPPARGGHTGIVVGNLFIVFGGTYYAGGDKFMYLDDIWAFDLDTHKWHKPTCAGSAPGARYGHGACVLDYKMYIFGGRGEAGLLYNDLHCLDVASWSWELCPTTSAPPSPRLGHAQLGVGDRVVVHGGWNGGGAGGSAPVAYNDLWLYDVSSCAWLRPKTNGIGPSPRHGHSGVFDETGARILLFGGCSYDDKGHPHYEKDCRELSLRNMTWSRPRVSGDYPSARYWHAGATLGNIMVSFGGYNGPRPAADCEVIPTGTIEIPHQPGMGHGATAEPGTVITVPSGTHPDLYLLDMETGEWVLPTVAGRPPNRRHGACLATSGLRMLLFGGWEESRSMNDLVVLDMSALVAGGGEGTTSGAAPESTY